MILKEVTAFGEPALRRVYGDWSSGQLKKWTMKVKSLGLVAHQETANTTGKNASDIGLVIDAMDILHSGRFDGFVLVSSDSDFTRLASRIREQGLEVIGIGERKTLEALRNVCNRFVFVENLVEEPEKEVGETLVPDTKKVPATKAVPIILKAIDQLDGIDDWYSLSAVGARIMAEITDFDTRTYGEKKLSDLAKKLNVFDLKQDSGRILIRRKP